MKMCINFLYGCCRCCYYFFQREGKWGKIKSVSWIVNFCRLPFLLKYGFCNKQDWMSWVGQEVCPVRWCRKTQKSFLAMSMFMPADWQLSKGSCSVVNGCKSLSVFWVFFFFLTTPGNLHYCQTTLTFILGRLWILIRAHIFKHVKMCKFWNIFCVNSHECQQIHWQIFPIKLVGFWREC